MLKNVLRRHRAITAVTAVIILLLAAHVLFVRPYVSRLDIFPSKQATPLVASPQNDLSCRNLPAVDDVVVILRTGATEIQDKLPIHINTTFRCYNDLIIFSDYEEIFHGHSVHDVLASVSQDWKKTNSDFEIYNRLRQYGRAGLRPEELSGSASFEGSKGGKNSNAGWRLDKWKFLPMMRETLKHRPDKKWYVYLESDSYVVWSNLLQWLKKLDSAKPLYYGSENQIGPDLFAHGGSVFVMSRPAVEKAAEIYELKEEEWHRWTAGHWAGDCVLGKALLEASVPLTWSWPMFQGGKPENMDFTEQKGENKKLWCAPALSYHHLSPTEMQRMWHFEQLWIRSRLERAESEHRSPWMSDRSEILHHRDVFRQFVLPNITTEWREWNNLSPDLIMAGKDDFDVCHHLCEQSEGCLQFAVGPPGCSISTKSVTLGQRWADFRSYWVINRVNDWMESMDNGCNGLEDWLVT